MRMTNDQIGELAERIAAVDLTRPVSGIYRRPLFRVAPLGGKYPTVDFLVDVVDDRDASIGFFFAQVKGTVSIGPPASRLPIEVRRDRYNALVRLSAPSFIIGVDVTAELSYIIAAHRVRTARVSSIAKTYCLRDDAVKIGLYEEVLSYWDANRPALQRTQFKDV